MSEYAARLEVDYPEALDKVKTFFRLILIIPISIILGLLLQAGETVTKTVTFNGAGEVVLRVTNTTGGLLVSLFLATALMIIFRRRYPRWWFDFAHELTRFIARVSAYLFLLTDQYPSTVDEQSIHLEIDYPDAQKNLDQFQPLFKWLLAIPHYIALFFLGIAAIFAVIIAWFIILRTGRYPRELFDFVVRVMRWGLRVYAYAFLLVTDDYPPFIL
jgi:hypothetical protein